MKNEKKNRVLFIRLVYICIAASFAAAAGVVFLPSFKSVMLVVSALLCAAAIILAYRVLDGMEKRLDGVEDVISETDGYAEIRYDKKAETAYILGDIAEITGIDISSSVLDDVDYKKLILDMISCPTDAGTDIYMAAKPDSWIKVHLFENDDFEFTMISDVSELVTCKNIIKSLKYYDSDTGLLCRDAFISKVRSALGSKAGTLGLVTILIGGVDRLTSFKGTAAADRVVSKAAAFVKKFENPHNIFGGRTATNEFCILVTDTYEDGCRKYADKLHGGIIEALSSSEGSEYIRIYCGYAFFGEEENDAGSMMSAADYAVFEAKSTGAVSPVEFNRTNYVLRAYDFRKIQVFNKVVSEGLVSYHFQPVVDAKTGAVFGYEALMRPNEIDGIKLSPTEVVEIAEKQGMSASVEKLTLKNTIGFLFENKERFSEKKLFINAIPNCFLPEDDYNDIYNAYSSVFGRLIVEITEGVQITPKSIDVLRERYSGKGALIAMDDYGTGYANESTLLTIKPDFIKIDRSLIMGIDGDVRKQHLVSNMIDFAHSHGIKALGEGVETRSELETLIIQGIDLIQGYYTSKPKAELLDEIPAEIKDEILGINLKNLGYAKKECRLDSEKPYDVAELAVTGCTDVIAAAENITLVSGTSGKVSMRLICEDGCKCTINIDSVNIFGLDAPVLTLGKNCDVTLNVTGENSFSYEGIRVPASSSLTIRGNGILDVDMNNNGGVIIGGSYLQDFGSVTVNMGGTLNISSQSENMVAIGGGVGGKDSSVEISRGTVNAELKGVSAIGVGAVSGSVKIKLGEKCRLNISGAGQNVVAVGTRSGNADILCRAEVTADCSGDNCCALGTLENGSGKMRFDGGIYHIETRSKNGVGIGAVCGNISTEISSGKYDISCEANSAAGIGDCTGSGDVFLSGGMFKIRVSASQEIPAGSLKGKTVISGGNFIIDSREKLNGVSPFGEPLEEVRRDCESFEEKISFKGSEYVYSAKAAEGESYVCVYLPVGYGQKR